MPSDASSRDDGAGAAGPDRFEVAVALTTVLLGAFVLGGSFAIDFGAGYDRIGARFFPHLVAAGLLLSGSLLTWMALRRGISPAEVRREQTSAAAIATLSFALVASVLLLERAGFILTSTFLFWFVARAFASRRPWRDAAVGVLLSTAVYLAFTRGLGLVLPRGLLGSLL